MNTIEWRTKYAQSGSRVGIYVSSKHKCATTLIKNLYARMSSQANLGLENQLFDFVAYRENGAISDLLRIFPKGKRLFQWNGGEKISTPNNFCCACSRLFEIDIVNHNNHDEIWYVFQIRDPRDILVSEYFSYGWTHAENEKISNYRKEIQKMGIDKYCKRSAEDLIKYLEKLIRILHKLNDKNVIILSYEQMVLDFKWWIDRAICPFRFEKHEKIREILFETWKHRVKPPKIEQRSHIRKVTPGDHREKLESQTIGYLTKRFGRFLKNKELFYYDYDYS